VPDLGVAEQIAGAGVVDDLVDIDDDLSPFPVSNPTGSTMLETSSNWRSQ
jgi:hypothetical protein